MTVQDIISNEDFMLKAFREGINKSMFENLRQLTGFNKGTMARLVHISTRTLERKGKNDKINPEASERAILIGKLAYVGKETFGDKSKFDAWLKTPHNEFGGEKPIDLLTNLIGINKVFDELYKIQYGIY